MSEPTETSLGLPPDCEQEEAGARFRIVMGSISQTPLIEVSFNDGDLWAPWITYQSIVLAFGWALWETEVDRLRRNGGGKKRWENRPHEEAMAEYQNDLNTAISQSAAWRKAWLVAKGEK